MSNITPPSSFEKAKIKEKLIYDTDEKIIYKEEEINPIMLEILKIIKNIAKENLTNNNQNYQNSVKKI